MGDGDYPGLGNYLNNFGPNTFYTNDVILNIFYNVLFTSYLLCIVLHSFYLKKFVYSSSRICTDVACVAAIIENIFYMRCQFFYCSYDDYTKFSGVGNMLFHAIFQLCEYYLTFDRSLFYLHTHIHSRFLTQSSIIFSDIDI